VAHDVLAAGEGIETMLSIRCVMPTMPMVAALSAAHLAAILFPATLRRLYIARDDDPAGDAAMSSLIDRANQAGIEAMALSFGVSLAATDVQDPAEIGRAVEAFAREPNGGLIVLPAPITNNHRELIIALAARHRLPTAYPFRFFVTSGGLVSYGADPFDQSRQAAAYVDRILKGEKPEDLPIQQPTKFEFVINLKTAKALGVTIPQTLLARADEVIE